MAVEREEGNAIVGFVLQHHDAAEAEREADLWNRLRVAAVLTVPLVAISMIAPSLVGADLAEKLPSYLSASRRELVAVFAFEFMKKRYQLFPSIIWSVVP